MKSDLFVALKETLLENILTKENSASSLTVYENPTVKLNRETEKVEIKKEEINGKTVKDERSASFEIEDNSEDEKELEIKSKSKLKSLVLTVSRKLIRYKPGLTISVDYPDQKYTYKLRRKIGHWPEYPMFQPDLSPEEILCLGVFEGQIFKDSYVEFPREWFLEAIELDKISVRYPLKRYNRYNVYALDYIVNFREENDDKDDSELRVHDPRGFLQWYFRFYLGRRVPTVDRARIQRWIQFKRRFLPMLKNCKKGDLNCKPRLKQSILCWAIDPEK